MKETLARVWYELWCQCPVVRFEERAKEWGPMARLTQQWGSRSESNKPATQQWVRGGVGSRGVIGPRPGTR